MKILPDNVAGVDRYLTTRKLRVDAELLKILKKIQPKGIKPKDFESSTFHSVIEGGKRIRPILAVAVYEACGGKGSSIYAPACTAELIHAGSLILDDLPCMDNAEMRRGKPTTHKLFGESTTILASAALWAAAFEILSETKTGDIAPLIHKMSLTIGSRGLVQGQLLDLESFNSVQNTDDLQECYRLKTGVLFSLSSAIGATLAGKDSKTVKQFEKFGEELGIAFQIQDDILDATMSFDETGKDTHLDEKNNKPNFVSLLGIEATKKILEEKRSALKRLIDNLDVSGERLLQIIDIIIY